MRPADLSAAWGGLSPPVRGAAWMILANVFFTVMNTLVRELSARYGLFEVVFFRSFFGLVFVLLMVAPAGFGSLRTKAPGLQAGRGLLALAAMSMWFYAVGHMPLAEATAINFSAPVFAAVIIGLFLGERMRVRRWTAIAIGFAGMLIVLRPGLVEFTLAVAAALGASVLMAVGAAMVRTLVRRDHPNAVVFYVPAILTVASLPVAAATWRAPGVLDLVLFVLLGLAGTLAHHAWVRSFAATEATAVLPYDFSRLPMMALSGYLLYAEVPDAWTWAGGAVILGSSVYIAHRETAAHRRRR